MSPKSIQRVAAAAANATTSLTNQNASYAPPSSLSSNASQSPDSSCSDGCYHDVDQLEDTISEQDIIGSLMDFDAFFQSPKCMDYMLNQCSFFAPDPMEDCDEEGEIRLWSFC